MLISEILEKLLEAADKAASIASIIRKEKPLVELLVQEKKSIQKNNDFFPDFKTLADVLIQETVRHDLSIQVPGIGSSVYGEESNKFTNANGESVVVELHESKEDTKKLLNLVLDGNEEASSLLAQAVHQSGKSPILPKDKLAIDILVDECGVWIDPIDSTGQYIKGKLGEADDETGLVVDGLQCVAVLIGMFLKSSGTPIIGVIVQPFAHFNKDSNSWTSRTIWGVNYNDVKVTSLQAQPTIDRNKQRIILSQSEAEKVKTLLSTKFDLMFASGAGYKLLATLSGQADAYVLSHHSIYRWDCCAVHAILCALGGGIISYKHALGCVREHDSQVNLSFDMLSKLQVSYIKASGAILSRRNSVSDETESLPGIIAYCSLDVVNSVLNILKSTV